MIELSSLEMVTLFRCEHERWGPEDSTIITIEHDDFNKTLEYLTEHIVQQSQKDAGEIIIKAQRDYKPLLKSLSEQGVYPKYIETRKVLY